MKTPSLAVAVAVPSHQQWPRTPVPSWAYRYFGKARKDAFYRHKERSEHLTKMNNDERAELDSLSAQHLYHDVIKSFALAIYFANFLPGSSIRLPTNYMYIRGVWGGYWAYWKCIAVPQSPALTFLRTVTTTTSLQLTSSLS